ncbi:MAG: response regulator transcription factor [Anaerolineae bacterium]|jgi:NarL family two-component system response regulator LiaR|nr:response regulator transcription factor [Anaerolineae bacterium]
MDTLPTIKVMLVDDHTVVRRGLATFLSAYEDLELMGEATNGLEAVSLCRRHQPDVILMDLMMPKMDGIAATRTILSEYPDVKVIAMTSFEEEELVHGVLGVGAISYLLKNVTADGLAKAIREAVSGRSTLSPEAAQVLIRGTRPVDQPKCDLTEREREVLNLVVQGKSNRQIADALVITVATAKAHISSILSKLQVASRTEAIAYAIRHGLASL